MEQGGGGNLYIRFEDPANLESMRGLKRWLPPNGILNPGKIFV